MRSLSDLFLSFISLMLGCRDDRGALGLVNEIQDRTKLYCSKGPPFPSSMVVSIDPLILK